MNGLPEVGAVVRNANGAPHTCVAYVQATLTQSWVGTNRFETAAWYETVRCEPQTVTVPLWGLWGDSWASLPFAGTVVESHFPTLLGGAPVAPSWSTPGPDNAGRTGIWTLTVDGPVLSHDGHPSLPITWHVL